MAWGMFRLYYSFNSFGDYLEDVHRFSFGLVIK
jgi:hypothetical protein